MKAGYNLDVLVARKVMGLNVVGFSVQEYSGDVPTGKPVYTLPNRTVAPVPCYSTDIVAAWEIVNKLLSEKWEWRGGFCPVSWGDPVQVMHNIQFRRGDEDGHAKAGTIEEAICRAALLAVGVDVEKELKG